MSYKKSAEDILEAIGGEDNLDAMALCHKIKTCIKR